MAPRPHQYQWTLTKPFREGIGPAGEVVNREGFVSWINPRKHVLRLHKALYGLKQGARSETDHGVFVKRWGDGQVVVVAVHVDDCLTTGSSQMLGPCKWLLGIKITHNVQAGTIALSQHAYVDSIVTRFNFNDLKPSSIAMDPTAPLIARRWDP